MSIRPACFVAPGGNRRPTLETDQEGQEPDWWMLGPGEANASI